MSLYQTVLRPTSFAPVKDEFLLAVRTRLVVDALVAFGLIILPMAALITLLFLLSSADPTTAAPWSVDGTGMLILPP